MRRALAIFRAAGDAGILRLPDPMVAGQVLARAAVPLLEVLSRLPAGDQLFLEAMAGMLLVPEEPLPPGADGA